MTNDLVRLGVHIVQETPTHVTINTGAYTSRLHASLKIEGVLAVEDHIAQTLTIPHNGLEVFKHYWHNLPSGGVEGTTIQHLILEIAWALVNKNEPEADLLLLQLQERATQQDNPWEARVAQVFLGGLQAQRQKDTQYLGNLYNKGDMLSAFNILMSATPLIIFGDETITHVLVNELKDRPNIHIVDLGIGAGVQWFGFFAKIAQHGIHKIRITGTDLPIQGDDPQVRVGDALRQQAQLHGIDVEYSHLTESLEVFDPIRLQLREDETVIFNVALVLHHLQETTRNDVLQKIYAQKPHLVTMIEPDSEHHNLPYLPRVLEAVRHYGNVFDMFSILLADNYQTERTILEQVFFGREIINILSLDDSVRFERHERLLSWIKRMITHGFIPFDLASYQRHFDGEWNENFSIETVENALRLSWKGYPIIGVSVWRTTQA